MIVHLLGHPTNSRCCNRNKPSFFPTWSPSPCALRSSEAAGTEEMPSVSLGNQALIPVESLPGPPEGQGSLKVWPAGLPYTPLIGISRQDGPGMIQMLKQR